MRIRDETQLTRQKVLTRRPKGIPQPPNVAVDQKARAAFFSYYVNGFTKTYDVLESLYAGSSSHEHLDASVDAVSLAFFSFQLHHAEVSSLARERYLKALPLVNGALRTPAIVKSDATLLAVLLLDLFEKISSHNTHSADSWMSHMNGALALIQMRGIQKYHHYAGLRLSVRLTTNLLISCIAANAPVPAQLVNLRSELEQYIKKEDPKWQLTSLVVKYANIQAAVRDGSLSDSDIVANATAVDVEFNTLEHSMPPSWRYIRTYIGAASQRILERHFDTYPDHVITQSWNVLRIMRILLLDIVRTSQGETLSNCVEQCASPSGSDSESLRIANLIRDICATVPQFTIYQPKPKDDLVIQALRCHTLLFPLYVAGLYSIPQSSIRIWIMQQLRFLAGEVGVLKAGIVADILQSGASISPWEVYVMLGSYATAA